MRFDCIIPTYNNREELARCLAGLAAQTHDDFRAIICIDGSTDGTAEWLADYKASFELLVLEHEDKQNHGRNATRNLSLPKLKAEYSCFIDSDLVPEADMLAEHERLLSQHDCVSVGNVLYKSAQDNLWSAYAQTRGKNKYSQGQLIPYYYLATGNCAHRTELFLGLGGQDAAITRYGGGDTEYALRLHQHYHKDVRFNQRALALGDMRKSLDEALQQLEDFGRTNLHYIHKKHPAETQIFMLHRFIGTTFGDSVFRTLLSLPISSVVQSVAQIMPRSVGILLLNYCVLARMYKGWRQGRLA